MLTFLTNNFALPALTITQLYCSRWQVERLFRWIKRHLRIKAFFGTSENAVKSQIWIAVAVYVLVAIVKGRLKLEASLYEILQLLSLTMFERIPLVQLLARVVTESVEKDDSNQLVLFEYRWDTPGPHLLHCAAAPSSALTNLKLAFIFAPSIPNLRWIRPTALRMGPRCKVS